MVNEREIQQVEWYQRRKSHKDLSSLKLRVTVKHFRSHFLVQGCGRATGNVAKRRNGC